jgi:hypothetical protein
VAEDGRDFHEMFVVGGFESAVVIEILRVVAFSLAALAETQLFLRAWFFNRLFFSNGELEFVEKGVDFDGEERLSVEHLNAADAFLGPGVQGNFLIDVVVGLAFL